MVIDMHAHYVPPQVLAELQRRAGDFPNIKLGDQGAGPTLQFPKEPPTRPLPKLLMDVARRREWMEAAGIDLQILGGWLDIFGYTLAPGEGLAWSGLLNDQMAAFVKGEAEFAGLATVPLQDGDLAVKELERSLDLGLCGVLIGTYVDGKELDDPSLEVFWEAVSQKGVPVVIHPVYGGGEERLGRFGLPNAIGRPFETTVAASALLYGGVLARHPGLKIVLCHGGGYVPAGLGRMDRSFWAVEGARKNTGVPPSEQFRALYLDTVVFDPEVLTFAASKVGRDRVLLGSDYPFPIGDPSPTEVVLRAGLGQEDEQKVLQGNTRRLFKL